MNTGGSTSDPIEAVMHAATAFNRAMHAAVVAGLRLKVVLREIELSGSEGYGEVIELIRQTHEMHVAIEGEQ